MDYGDHFKQIIHRTRRDRISPFFIVVLNTIITVFAFSRHYPIWVEAVCSAILAGMIWFAVRSAFLSGMGAAYADAAKVARECAAAQTSDTLPWSAHDGRPTLRVMGPS